jgi:hypothetical protein
MGIRSRLLIVLAASSLVFNGCAFVAEGVANALVHSLIDAAISPRKSVKPTPSRTETVTSVKLINGDTLTLLDYRVVDDTLFGE